jgi:hypothetical protein
MNVHTGEVKPWVELTPEQQASGEWIRLPHDAGLAQRDPASALKEFIPVEKQTEHTDRIERLNRAAHREESQFANRGRSR